MKSARRKKAISKLLTVWVSEELLPLLDKGVQKDDSDRSKFIRKAIREKLSRQGVLKEKRA